MAEDQDRSLSPYRIGSLKSSPAGERATQELSGPIGQSCSTLLRRRHTGAFSLIADVEEIPLHSDDESLGVARHRKSYSDLCPSPSISVQASKKLSRRLSENFSSFNEGHSFESMLEQVSGFLSSSRKRRKSSSSEVLHSAGTSYIALSDLSKSKQAHIEDEKNRFSMETAVGLETFPEQDPRISQETVCTRAETEQETPVPVSPVESIKSPLLPPKQPSLAKSLGLRKPKVTKDGEHRALGEVMGLELPKGQVWRRKALSSDLGIEQKSSPGSDARPSSRHSDSASSGATFPMGHKRSETFGSISVLSSCMSEEIIISPDPSPQKAPSSFENDSPPKRSPDSFSFKSESECPVVETRTLRWSFMPTIHEEASSVRDRLDEKDLYLDHSDGIGVPEDGDQSPGQNQAQEQEQEQSWEPDVQPEDEEEYQQADRTEDNDGEEEAMSETDEALCAFREQFPLRILSPVQEMSEDGLSTFSRSARNTPASHQSWSPSRLSSVSLSGTRTPLRRSMTNSWLLASPVGRRMLTQQYQLHGSPQMSPRSKSQTETSRRDLSWSKMDEMPSLTSLLRSASLKETSSPVSAQLADLSFDGSLWTRSPPSLRLESSKALAVQESPTKQEEGSKAEALVSALNEEPASRTSMERTMSPPLTRTSSAKRRSTASLKLLASSGASALGSFLDTRLRSVAGPEKRNSLTSPVSDFRAKLRKFERKPSVLRNNNVNKAGTQLKRPRKNRGRVAILTDRHHFTLVDGDDEDDSFVHVSQEENDGSPVPSSRA